MAKVSKTKSRKRYKHKHIAAPSKFAKGSIRTVTRGKTKIRVGCPKGAFNKKTQRCRVGTRAVSILKPNPKPMTFRIFVVFTDKKTKHPKYAYLSKDGWDSDYTKSLKFYRETAIFMAKEFAALHPKNKFGVSDGKA